MTLQLMTTTQVQIIKYLKLKINILFIELNFRKQEIIRRYHRVPGVS